MSLYKQGEIWWYEFYVGRKRYRSSTRTTDKTVAQKVEAEHRESLMRGGAKISPTLNAIKVAEAATRRAKIWEGIETQTDPPKPSKLRENERSGITPKTLLREAGDLWLSRQRRVCRPRTVESNTSHLRRLVEFFGNIPLAQFTIGHFEHYQSLRGARCGASAVNHELNTLSRILKRADLWYPIKSNYTPLKDREAKPVKIFTAAEQERIFRALKNDPNLELGEIVFTITRNTTASGCELRGLRLRNLELEADPPRIHIPPDSTKNNIRPRTIPLNGAALVAVKRALERAKKLGSHYPDDYLFPLRIDRATWDPKQPASRSWLRKQVTYLRELTGIDHITPHIFRHLAVTEILELGARTRRYRRSRLGWAQDDRDVQPPEDRGKGGGSRTSRQEWAQSTQTYRAENSNPGSCASILSSRYDAPVRSGRDCPADRVDLTGSPRSSSST